MRESNITYGSKDHECNKDAVIYIGLDGIRSFFTDQNEADEFYRENYTDITSGSVACSICGHAAIDDHWKIN